MTARRHPTKREFQVGCVLLAIQAVGIVGIVGMIAAMLILGCSQPSAPEPQPQLQAGCMAWVTGGILCCQPSPEAGTCIWYPTEMQNKDAGSLTLSATCSE